MDNLAREAMLAKKAGMSYGKWKAMQEPKKPKKKPVPENWLVCEYCGKQFKPTTKRPQRFCEHFCQVMSYREKNREKNNAKVREWRAKQKEDACAKLVALMQKQAT